MHIVPNPLEIDVFVDAFDTNVRYDLGTPHNGLILDSLLCMQWRMGNCHYA